MGNSFFFLNNKRGEGLSGYTTLNTFAPTVTKSNGEVRWNLNNEYFEAADTPTYTMVGGSPYYFELQTDKGENLSSIDFSNSQILGNLRFLALPELGGGISAADNSNLTAITLGSSSKDFSTIDFSSCDLRELDLSPLSGDVAGIFIDTNPSLSAFTFPSSLVNLQNFLAYGCDLRELDFSNINSYGIFRANNNSNLTAVTFSATSEAVSQMRFFSCDLRNVDISMFSGDINNVYFYSNSNLSAITFPTSSAIINNVYTYSCDLRDLDLSTMSNLKGQMLFNSNSNLTAVTFPSSSQEITNMVGSNCDLRNFDISNLTNIVSGSINLDLNANLTAVTLPDIASTSSVSLSIRDCNITDIDLSGFSGLSNALILENNTNLTGITFPENWTKTISVLSFNSCNYITDLDLTPLSGTGGNIFLALMNSLSSVTFPNTTQDLSRLYLQGNVSLGVVNLYQLSGANGNDMALFDYSSCGLSAAEVNQVLYDLDTIGWTGGTLEIDSNSTPDTTSGGYNGIAALANLTGKSWSVTNDWA
jgi:hypothetical protein